MKEEYGQRANGLRAVAAKLRSLEEGFRKNGGGGLSKISNDLADMTEPFARLVEGKGAVR